MSLGSLIQSIKNYNPEADFDLLEYVCNSLKITLFKTRFIRSDDDNIHTLMALI